MQFQLSSMRYPLRWPSVYSACYTLYHPWPNLFWWGNFASMNLCQLVFLARNWTIVTLASILVLSKGIYWDSAENMIKDLVQFEENTYFAAELKLGIDPSQFRNASKFLLQRITGDHPAERNISSSPNLNLVAFYWLKFFGGNSFAKGWYNS